MSRYYLLSRRSNDSRCECLGAGDFFFFFKKQHVAQAALLVAFSILKPALSCSVNDQFTETTTSVANSKAIMTHLFLSATLHVLIGGNFPLPSLVQQTLSVHNRFSFNASITRTTLSVSLQQ